MRVKDRIKPLLFFLCALAVFFISRVGFSALNTLARLDAVEAERDQWQRPEGVIQALDLKPGNVVADIGCGSGYFTLKLSSPVGSSGRVIAEDIRWLSLEFLWVRSIRKRNVRIIHGEPNDPRLPVRGVNAVLISNTYHEFTDGQAILAHVSQSLVPSGRLVVVDREPNSHNIGVTESGDHEISAARVEEDLRRAHFEIVSREDRFIESDPDRESWWLIVARKPSAAAESPQSQ